MTWHAQGVSKATIKRADTAQTALIGTDPNHAPCRGYAGVVEETDQTILIRDVLGRYPLYSDAQNHGAWAFDPTELRAPQLVPAGTKRRLITGSTTDDLWTDEQRFTLPHGRADYTDPTTAGELLHQTLGDVFTDLSAGPVGTGGHAAVAFSGGVDSAVVAQALDVPCYVAGFADSQDVAVAQKTAAALDLDLRTVEITHADIKRVVPEIAHATLRTNPMDVSIALPLYIVASAAAQDGFDRLAVGQGADELFGGYQKIVNPAQDHRVQATTVRGARREMMGSLAEQLPRDISTLRAAGIEPVAPFLDDRIIDVALNLAGPCIVSGERRKVALREAATRRVPAAVAEREKKAVQYGSNVSRELDRLARQAGFKRRMDDHIGQYVRSLL
jgi:asparagine synthase (glutamine-hydrolysing)